MYKIYYQRMLNVEEKFDAGLPIYENKDEAIKKAIWLNGTCFNKHYFVKEVEDIKIYTFKIEQGYAVKYIMLYDVKAETFLDACYKAEQIAKANCGKVIEWIY